MTLLVISHTDHIVHGERIYGWGPTVREINFLATKFAAVKHIAPLRKTDVPSSYHPISDNVNIIPVRNRGGESISAKLKVLIDSYQYFTAIARSLPKADIVHVRCPANIALIALLVLTFAPKKRKWIKYAGNWKPNNDFLSYKIQRFLLKKIIPNSVVTINEKYLDNKTHIKHLLNPSYFLSEIKDAQNKMPLKTLPSDKIELLFVGSLNPGKGADTSIHVIKHVLQHIPDVKLRIVGEGKETGNLKLLVQQLNLDQVVSFEGWKSKEDLKYYYTRAHFILLPSKGEGWPKVISEAMVFGVVPITSDVSGVKHTLAMCQTGVAISGFESDLYANAVLQYIAHPGRWTLESEKAKESSMLFSYELWWNTLSKLIELD